MKKKRIITLAVTAILTVCVLISVLSASVYATEDYSSPGTLDKTAFDSSEILKLAIGDVLGDEEERYLSEFGEESIVFGSNIPASVVTFDYREDKTLHVVASEYTYTATNGALVVWRPTEAQLGTKTAALALESNGYTATFEGVEEDDGARLSVKYSTEITISESTVNALVNKAIDDVDHWKKYIVEKAEEYEEAKALYDVALDKYEIYLEALMEYDSAMLVYNAYLSAKRIYDEALEEYNGYLAALDDYKAACSAYAEYQKALAQYNKDYEQYSAYLAEKDRFDKELERYNEYFAKYEKVKHQLSIISGTKNKSTALERTVYDAVMGETVTMVIENKDLLTNQLVDVNEDTILLADKATKSLRSLYDGFFAAKTEAEQYAYYVVNYEAFKTNFTDLLRSLDEFYSNGKIRVGFDEVPQLKERNMKVKYEILLAQLFYVVNAISDETVYNNSGVAYNSSYYFVYKAKTPYALLENSVYIEDKNSATPLDGGYPVPVSKPSVTVVTEPKRPATVPVPIEPEMVEHPGTAPTPVAKPTPPTVVADPGEAPKPYVTPDSVKGLLLAADEGRLSRRAPFVGAVGYTPEITVTKKVFGAEVVTVRFYDYKNTLIYGPIEVERGTYAEYLGPDTARPDDVAGSYTFTGWADESGARVNLSSIDPRTSELALYPTYDVDYNFYTVTWFIDGVRVEEEYRYGTLPSYGEDPYKPDDAKLSYTFLGWHIPVSPVVGDALYVAMFDSRYLAPVVGGKGLSVSSLDGNYTVDASSYESFSVNIENVLTRAAFSGSLTFKTRGFLLEFSYAEVISLRESGVASLDVIYKSEGGEYSFGFTARDASGAPLGARASVRVPCSISDPAHAVCYYLTEGGREYVRANVSDTLLSLQINSERDYVCRVEYAVEPITPTVGTLTLDKYAAGIGERVTLIYGIPEGYALKGAYYVDTEGVRVAIDGDSFLAPAGGVSVGMELYPLEYTVRFVSDGKIISEAVYRYGEMPILPSDPSKASDGVYDYKFTGWSAEVVAAYSDATYTATYEKTLIPEDDKPDGPAISPGILKALMLVLVLATYGLGVIAPFGVIITLRYVRAARRKGTGRAKN